MMKHGHVTHIAFFCANEMVAVVNSDDLLSNLSNLNITEVAPGQIRHYHIHIKAQKEGPVWVMKGGRQVKLAEVYVI